MPHEVNIMLPKSLMHCGFIANRLTYLPLKTINQSIKESLFGQINYALVLTFSIRSAQRLNRPYFSFKENTEINPPPTLLRDDLFWPHKFAAVSKYNYSKMSCLNTHVIYKPCQNFANKRKKARLTRHGYVCNWTALTQKNFSLWT